jgi:hypothetical protein
VGYLQYGNSNARINFDDRTLGHLQVVIMAKLRRDESFFFSWLDDPALGDGRSSIWLSTAIPLFFHFGGVARQEFNREWLELLTASANSARGLNLSDEPGAQTPRPKTSVVAGQNGKASTSRSPGGA